MPFVSAAPMTRAAAARYLSIFTVGGGNGAGVGDGEGVGEACGLGRDAWGDCSAKGDRCGRANVEISRAKVRVVDGIKRTIGLFFG